MKKSLIKKIRGGVGILKNVKISLLPILDLFTRLYELASSSYILVGLIEELT